MNRKQIIPDSEFRDLQDNHFRYTDAGRRWSKRPQQKEDCTVRATALAFGLDYDTAYTYLSKQGKKSHRRFNISRHLDKHKVTGLFNRSIQSMVFPAVKNQPPINMGNFVKIYSRGTYIIKVAKHVATVRDGVLQDTDTYWYKCVYKAWEITLEADDNLLDKHLEKWNMPQH